MSRPPPTPTGLLQAFWWPVAAVVTLALALWILLDRPSPSSTPPAVDGAALYMRHCASCHGADLEGQPEWRRRKSDGRLPAPPHDDSGHTWHHDDALLLRIVREGMVPPHAPDGYASDMPAFAGVLSDAEIRAVLDHIASRWSDEVRRQRAERFGN